MLQVNQLWLIYYKHDLTRKHAFLVSILNYIDMCNEIAFANRLALYPCKLLWVKIVLQKPLTLLIHAHIPTTLKR